jgi:hypothetical protein
MQMSELIVTFFRRSRQPQFHVLPVQLDQIQWLLKREERLVKSQGDEGGLRQGLNRLLDRNHIRRVPASAFSSGAWARKTIGA